MSKLEYNGVSPAHVELEASYEFTKAKIAEHESLRAQLKEARAEIERLYSERGIISGHLIKKLHGQLAASQAREVQLREAFEAAKFSGNPYCLKVRAALSLPSDTTALESMIQKAGEVMRERACVAVKGSDWLFANESDPKAARYYISPQARTLQSGTIRAIPGVMVEDLK